MSEHTQMCLVIFGIFGTLIGMMIYAADRSCKKDEERRKCQKIIMDARLEAEKSQPRFKIQFQIIGETHETEPFDPYILSYSRERIVTSKELAMKTLVVGIEDGYIPNKFDVVFPVCNILNAKVVQHVETT